MSLRPDCVFCDIIHGKGPADIVMDFPGSMVITPLGPVVDGHKIVIPKTHVSDALHNPSVTGRTMQDASTYAVESEVGPCNFITSVGKEATQSVFHLHIHVVPRDYGDRLALPWHSGR